jgi:methyl-accepting chemotaxis protein
MKLTLGKKLGLGFGVILALMVLSTVISYVKLADVKENQELAFGVRFPSLETARQLQRDLNQAGNKGRQAILAGGEDATRREAAKKLADDTWIAIDKDVSRLSELSPHWVRQENRDRLAEIKRTIPTFREVQDAEIARAANGERDAVVKAGNGYADRATPINNAIRKTLEDIAGSFEEVLQQNHEALNSATRSLNLTMAVTTFVALGIGIGVAVYLSRRISAATQSILVRAEAIAARDLTREELKAQGNDELADLTRAINQMQSSLHELIQSMRGTAEQVAASSEELSATSQQITANSEETTAQAKVVSEAGGQVNANLQTLASGAEEMSATIGEIAKYATEAARVAGEAVASAESANQTVSKLGDSSNIKGVAEAAQNTSTNVSEAQTATEHLSKMANQLRDLVGRFKVGAESQRKQVEDHVPKAARHAAGAH